MYKSIVQWAATYWSRLLLLTVPFGIAASKLGFSHSTVFILNCIAIIPLADVLCRATDDASSFLGETSGALLNITMGNVTELVILYVGLPTSPTLLTFLDSVHALLQRQYTIVRTSLLGSSIVNILLVLGLSIVAGETRERGQMYNVVATRIAAGMLCLTSISLIVPSTLRFSSDAATQTHDVLEISRAISVVLVFIYFGYLWIQTASPRFSYKPLAEPHKEACAPEMVESTELHVPRDCRSTYTQPHDPLIPTLELGSELALTLKSTPAKRASWLRKATPLFLLIVSTALIFICGEVLVSSVDHVVDNSPISKTMVGLVILPIVGNAAELISGVMFALRGQMDLAFAVAIGSAVQIAMFVTPLVVLLGWGLGREMGFCFTGFERGVFGGSVVLFLVMGVGRRCGMVKGGLLLAGYIVIGYMAMLT
ncbi:unnamed protein product [Periconia digitata]|uniref:Sodium/calcium exchanger membrane region domain-containing protein n=1 Tax=Periconia digitata TaxID=1303443 RepID=A0A9W4U3L6_9PLEO|nr:unnamed protein product [Periconia digitata]